MPSSRPSWLSEAYGSSVPKGGVGSHPGSISGFSIEKITHKDCSVYNIKDTGSLNTSSTANLKRKKWEFLTSILPSKKSNEAVFRSKIQYNNLVLPDTGRVLRGNSSDNVLTIPVSVSSSDTPSISSLESAVMRSEAVHVSTSVSVDPNRQLHNIV